MKHTITVIALTLCLGLAQSAVCQSADVSQDDVDHILTTIGSGSLAYLSASCDARAWSDAIRESQAFLDQSQYLQAEAHAQNAAAGVAECYRARPDKSALFFDAAAVGKLLSLEVIAQNQVLETDLSRTAAKMLRCCSLGSSIMLRKVAIKFETVL